MSNIRNAVKRYDDEILRSREDVEKLLAEQLDTCANTFKSLTRPIEAPLSEATSLELNSLLSHTINDVLGGLANEIRLPSWFDSNKNVTVSEIMTTELDIDEQERGKVLEATRQAAHCANKGLLPITDFIHFVCDYF